MKLLIALLLTALFLACTPAHAYEYSLEITSLSNVLALLCEDQNDQQQCIKDSADCMTELSMNETIKCVNKTINKGVQHDSRDFNSNSSLM